MPDKNPSYFMSLAIQEATTAKSLGDWPFGACVVCDGEVVGLGHAKDKTSGDVTDHAEMVALREACGNLRSNDLQNCEIYCTNEPCLMCAATIFQANICKVIIGVSRHELPHLLRPRRINIDHLAIDSRHEIKIEKGLLKNEILKLFGDIKK